MSEVMTCSFCVEKVEVRRIAGTKRGDVFICDQCALSSLVSLVEKGLWYFPSKKEDLGRQIVVDLIAKGKLDQSSTVRDFLGLLKSELEDSMRKELETEIATLVEKLEKLKALYRRKYPQQIT